VSATLNDPAAASAEYSPSEWPATKAELGLQHPHRRQANRHQRRLSILRQGESLDRPVLHQLVQPLFQRVVDLLEHRAGRGEGVRQLHAHADGLAALAGKEQG
jgi:hypothetical protein